VCAIFVLCACVSRQRDRFYVLDAQPAAAATSRSQFDRQVTLQVTVPSLVDRNEMVLETGDGVSVADHERWAAPLADLVTGALGRDIERRRSDVVVLPRSADRAGIPAIRIRVEIDRVSARLGAPLVIETHWRVSRDGREIVGRDVFTSPLQPENYSQVAAALSACIALLADRLATEIPAAGV
jgi:uncharacterized lipoprotein YmbA